MEASGENRDLLRARFRAATERTPGLALSFEAFLEEAETRARERVEKLRLEPTPERITRALRRMCLEDLYIVVACNAGEEAAWSAFNAEYVPRLRGLAVKQGCDRERADAEVTALLADLAMPPAGGGVRTLLGTYRATGSLFGWLAVILLRRIARAAKRLRPVPLEPEAQEAEATPSEEDPAARVDDAESAARLSAALEAGWRACTPNEQLALALKHRDGLAHRFIAEALGVGIPRVSQLLSQALARLASEARRHLPEGLEERAYRAASAAIGTTLATFHPPAPPTDKGRDPGDGA